MTESTDQPTKPHRTWLPMMLWTAGILLALTLVYLIGTVAIPFWRVHSLARWGLEGEMTQKHVASLGNPQRALRDIELYLGIPGPSEKQREAATRFAALFRDEKETGSLLLRLTRDRMPAVRSQALLQFVKHVGGRKEAVPVLVRALDDPDPRIRRFAAEEFPSCRYEEIKAEVVAGLERVLSDPDKDVRAAAAEALKKIRGEEEK